MSATSAAPAPGSQDSSGDSRELRRALGQFATGVTVVTTRDPASGHAVGMTANSFSSVSLEPPLILWSITRTARSLPAFLAASHFAVNVLSAEQIDLSVRFARPAEDRFAGIAWREGLGGAPLLPNLSALFECRRVASHEGGDHIILVGKVERFARFERPGLVFAQGRYGLVADHPMQQPAAAPESGRDPHPYDDFLIPLLFRAYETLFAAFSEELEAAGTSGPEMRILAVLSIRPGANFDRLTRAAYLGEQTTEAALARLIGAGHVAGDRRTGLMLTESGTARLAWLIRIAERFEAGRMGELGPGEVDRLKAMLRRLAGTGG
ncbi:flavin reductase (DIM6/NTAB) family NADH-FMN oxidoreductase RutF [Tepidamorphus gemmatus]|uniref:Flavin reductase (DIM6/NTAB) family NADH-FMN oxidoreductase RutF n=1 Tax=Tepidamorphus gemmatus TaxID=747076 RepID=A0A4R3MFQ8_9HYPH|nr:flavin reductase [Tepidamorphus gemmatus]TCT11933.1 flavin reductase (DIM6/NTAB) family NADH-FMN oxidoreductase RutF [Tepidamorphus gemmatus]